MDIMMRFIKGYVMMAVHHKLFIVVIEERNATSIQCRENNWDLILFMSLGEVDANLQSFAKKCHFV